MARSDDRDPDDRRQTNQRLRFVKQRQDRWTICRFLHSAPPEVVDLARLVAAQRCINSCAVVRHRSSRGPADHPVDGQGGLSAIADKIISDQLSGN